jgi:hypothetical protein
LKADAVREVREVREVHLAGRGDAGKRVMRRSKNRHAHRTGESSTV